MTNSTGYGNYQPKSRAGRIALYGFMAGVLVVLVVMVIVKA